MAPQQRKRGLSFRLGLSKSKLSRQDDDSERDSTNQSPPPYDSDLSPLVGDDKENLATEGAYLDAEDSTGTGEYVQICLHERLYFPRLQRINALTRLKDSDSGLPALSERDPCLDHGAYEPLDDDAREGNSVCMFRNYPGKGCFAVGSFRYTYPRFYGSNASPTQYPGVVLWADWTLRLHRFPRDLASLDTVNEVFAENPVFLCPHTRLIDLVGPERVLKGIQVATTIQDPITAWEVEEPSHFDKSCKHCHTMFYVEAELSERILVVRAERLLGKAKSSKDPIWLSQ
ncbi:MAG: hypothetical protein Q9220_006148 [cf. Caloplaca sp. 1 TL-2023]